jgi:hypothetical protein
MLGVMNAGAREQARPAFGGCGRRYRRVDAAARVDAALTRLRIPHELEQYEGDHRNRRLSLRHR